MTAGPPMAEATLRRAVSPRSGGYLPSIFSSRRHRSNGVDSVDPHAPPSAPGRWMARSRQWTGSGSPGAARRTDGGRGLGRVQGSGELPSIHRPRRGAPSPFSALDFHTPGWFSTGSARLSTREPESQPLKPFSAEGPRGFNSLRLMARTVSPQSSGRERRFPVAGAKTPSRPSRRRSTPGRPRSRGAARR